MHQAVEGRSMERRVSRADRCSDRLSHRCHCVAPHGRRVGHPQTESRCVGYRPGAPAGVGLTSPHASPRSTRRPARPCMRGLSTLRSTPWVHRWAACTGPPVRAGAAQSPRRTPDPPPAVLTRIGHWSILHLDRMARRKNHPTMVLRRVHDLEASWVQHAAGVMKRDAHPGVRVPARAFAQTAVIWRPWLRFPDWMRCWRR